MKEEQENAKLCYVGDGIAYFTTQDINKQHGDDWRKSPYEHNSGSPYEPCWHRRVNIERGEPLCDCKICKVDWDGDKPKWKIFEAAYYCPAELLEPSAGYDNSPYSVKDINKKGIPWLQSPVDGICIKPGTTLREFVKIIESVERKGKVFVDACDY